MRNLLTYTGAEKQGMIDGIGLFFGALIGTNLGSFGGLNNIEYTMLIMLLAGTVMSLRIFSATERRWHGYLLLITYSICAYHFLFESKIARGIADGDRDRLAITLAVWLGLVLLAELTPIRDVPPKLSRPAPPGEATAGFQEPS